MNTDLTNTITKGSKILNPRNSIGIVTNEDRCVVGVVLSVSGNLVTFRKIWDTEETKVFNARIFVPGTVTPEDSPNVEIDEIMPFFRVGDYNSSGDEAFEKHAENASNFSWIGFIQPAAAYEISDYYVLMDDSVTAYYVIDEYWRANFYNVSSDVQPYNYNRVQMYRNSNSGKPGYCVPSRNGYSTWKAKYYTAYDESTKTYSGLYFTQDVVFVSSLWSYDVILPRVGSGMENKLDLVPSGFHPFDYVEDEDRQACYLKIEETNTSDYSSIATSNSSTYLYDNSIDLTTLLLPGESVTINTTPVQLRIIDVVYTDHVSFTEALTTAISIGDTFTIDFVNRATWIYLSTLPTRFFWSAAGYFWQLSLGGSATSGDWYYRYATYGYGGICEESEELVCAAGAENINGTLYGGPIPGTNWEFPGIGNLAFSYTKAISYDYTYKALYGGGGVKISRLASDWKIWDRFATPPAWRNAVAGDRVQSVYVWEIWEGKQRQSAAYFSLTLI